MKELTYLDIAKLHIAAKKNKTFDDLEIKSKDELITYLKQGKTFSKLLQVIETNFCGIPSLIAAATFDILPKSYIAGINKGFKQIMSDNK